MNRHMFVEDRDVSKSTQYKFGFNDGYVAALRDARALLALSENMDGEGAISILELFQDQHVFWWSCSVKGANNCPNLVSEDISIIADSDKEFVFNDSGRQVMEESYANS